MDVDGIRGYCLSFPEANENIQWEDDLCFKIRGKIFAIVTLSAVPQKLCFKCAPEIFADLIEREDIHPAPYVGRYKWVMLNRLDALRTDEIRDLIRRSYEMVSAKAPARAKAGSKRPARATKRNRTARTPKG